MRSLKYSLLEPLAWGNTHESRRELLDACTDLTERYKKEEKKKPKAQIKNQDKNKGEEIKKQKEKKTIKERKINKTKRKQEKKGGGVKGSREERLKGWVRVQDDSDEPLEAVGDAKVLPSLAAIRRSE
jgi:hypothetical protein